MVLNQRSFFFGFHALSLPYAASTFWKLNTTSFLYTSTSCGTVLIILDPGAAVDHVHTYVSPRESVSQSSHHDRSCASSGPGRTLIVVEGGAIYIAVGMMFGNCQTFTIVLAVLFHHLSIFLMLTAGGFSMVDCQIRFILFFCSRQVEAYCNGATRRTEIVLTCFGSLLLLNLRQWR